MRIQYFDNYDKLSHASARMVLYALEQKPNLLLCAATGNSPTGLYRELALSHKRNRKAFDQLRILKLDEWGDVPADNPASCEHFIQHHIIRPLEISADRYFGFQNTPLNPESECMRVQKTIKEQGPIDICILGLGANGHMGLNEPSEHLKSHCHVAHLSNGTLSHGMIAQLDAKPSYGMTIGIEDILSAKHIIMLVVGSNKKEATKKLLSGEIDNQFPATHLHRHDNVDCLLMT